MRSISYKTPCPDVWFWNTLVKFTSVVYWEEDVKKSYVRSTASVYKFNKKQHKINHTASTILQKNGTIDTALSLENVTLRFCHCKIFIRRIHIQRLFLQNWLSTNASRHFWNANGLSYKCKFNPLRASTRHTKTITKLLNIYIFKAIMLYLSN